MSKSKLISAVLEVMKTVKNIEKNMTIGVGNNSYKGVSDKDVKNIIGKAMAENGLTIFPIDIEQATQVDRWEENFKGIVKNKQQIFTEVKTKYALVHESGAEMQIVGMGHGVDPSDKSAGKAITYALKTTLLNTFLIPTGELDEDGPEAPTPPAKKQQVPVESKESDTESPVILNSKHDDWDKVKSFLVENKGVEFDKLLPRLSKRYKIAKVTEKALKDVHSKA
jgi:hypothetical protein